MIALKDSLGTEFVERVRAFFSENGRLSKAKNFEFRLQQQEMAAAVANALEEERHLVVEAGTGVGKSLAYLTPAILFALEQQKRAIISTHTINLQEQLLYKDIPILKKILPVEFEAALMKGRQNYLCGRARPATDRLAICRSNPIPKCGSRSAANRTSAQEKRAGRGRAAFISKRASGFSRQT
jgi:ATP-dependent DNA helicase DinG